MPLLSHLNMFLSHNRMSFKGLLNNFFSKLKDICKSWKTYFRHLEPSICEIGYFIIHSFLGKQKSYSIILYKYLNICLTKNHVGCLTKWFMYWLTTLMWLDLGFSPNFVFCPCNFLKFQHYKRIFLEIFTFSKSI
jgi:hypothetical protein